MGKMDNRTSLSGGGIRGIAGGDRAGRGHLGFLGSRLIRVRNRSRKGERRRRSGRGRLGGDVRGLRNWFDRTGLSLGFEDAARLKPSSV